MAALRGHCGPVICSLQGPLIVFHFDVEISDANPTDLSDVGWQHWSKSQNDSVMTVAFFEQKDNRKEHNYQGCGPRWVLDMATMCFRAGKSVALCERGVELILENLEMGFFRFPKDEEKNT
ncbi:hypothetical protein NQ317_008808 [Molorchus minor]|uniref:Uncharacterized protein n=1 Tax=Molorchus minor TaxID=1323400 RepID=A0ABQ9IZA0_9CUCU|nr:hypothetical protein NQ317_008808 [Molorchus minor]